MTNVTAENIRQVLSQDAATTAARAPVSPDVVRAMSLDLFFDYLGVRLNGDKAEGRR